MKDATTDKIEGTIHELKGRVKKAVGRQSPVLNPNYRPKAGRADAISETARVHF